MGTASIHEGVRRMRFSSLLDRQERGEITQEEAAEMLGVYAGGPAIARAPQEELERILGLKYSPSRPQPRAQRNSVADGRAGPAARSRAIIAAANGYMSPASVKLRLISCVCPQPCPRWRVFLATRSVSIRPDG